MEQLKEEVVRKTQLLAKLQDQLLFSGPTTAAAAAASNGGEPGENSSAERRRQQLIRRRMTMDVRTAARLAFGNGGGGGGISRDVDEDKAAAKSKKPPLMPLFEDAVGEMRNLKAEQMKTVKVENRALAKEVNELRAALTEKQSELERVADDCQEELADMRALLEELRKNLSQDDASKALREEVRRLEKALKESTEVRL